MKKWIPIVVKGIATRLPVYGVPADRLGVGGVRQLRNMVWNKLTALPPIDVPGGWMVAMLDRKEFEYVSELSTEL